MAFYTRPSYAMPPVTGSVHVCANKAQFAAALSNAAGKNDRIELTDAYSDSMPTYGTGAGPQQLVGLNGQGPSAPLVIAAQSEHGATITDAGSGFAFWPSNSNYLHFYGLEVNTVGAWGVVMGKVYGAHVSYVRGPCSYVTFERIKVPSTGGEAGIIISNDSSWFNVLDCDITSGGEGIYIGTGADDLDTSHDFTIRGCVIEAGRVGGHTGGGEAIDLKPRTRRGLVEHNLIDGVNIASSTHSGAITLCLATNPNRMQNIHVAHVVRFNRIIRTPATQAGIQVNVEGMEVYGNAVLNCGYGVSVTSHYTGELGGPTKIWGNTFYGSNGADMYYNTGYGSGPARMDVRGNVYGTVSGSPASGSTVTNNLSGVASSVFVGPVSNDGDAGSGPCSGLRPNGSALDGGPNLDLLYGADLFGVERVSGSLTYGAFQKGSTSATGPTAVIDRTPSGGVLPGETIAFDAGSSTGTGPLSYFWEFGDGATSTAESPSHTYDEAGSYTVTLTVSNAVGVDSDTDSVTVQGAGGGDYEPIVVYVATSGGGAFGTDRAAVKMPSTVMPGWLLLVGVTGPPEARNGALPGLLPAKTTGPAMGFAPSGYAYDSDELVTYVQTALGCRDYGVHHLFVRVTEWFYGDIFARHRAITDAKLYVTLEMWDLLDEGATNSTYTLDSIVAGDHDADLERWADGFAAMDETVIVRPLHEMNQTFYPWCVDVNGNTASDYIAAWRHIVDLFRSRGATNVQWFWCPSDTEAPGTPDIADCYPGDQWVDIVGVDAYNYGDTEDWSQWQDPDELFDDHFTYISSFAGADKLRMVGETSCVESGGDKADWIVELGEWAETAGMHAVAWFDFNWDKDWRMQTDPGNWVAAQSWFHNGWHMVEDHIGSAWESHLLVAYKVADSSDAGATHTFRTRGDGDVARNWTVFRVANVDPDNPIDAEGTPDSGYAAQGADITAPAVTSVTDGAVAVNFMVSGSNFAQFGLVPAGWTVGSSYGGHEKIRSASKLIPTAGSSGAPVWDAEPNSPYDTNWSAHTVALRPVADGGAAGPEPVTASFTIADDTVLVGEVVSVTNTSTGDWDQATVDWGDGTPTVALGATATHAYAAADTYTVTVTASGLGGSDSDTDTVTVSAVTIPDPPPGPGGTGTGIITVEIAPSDAWNTPVGSATWVSLSAGGLHGDRVSGVVIDRQAGRPSRCTVELRNDDGLFDPDTGSLLPVPNAQLRVYATVDSVTYPLFRGHIPPREGWSYTDEHTTGTVTATAVDVAAVVAGTDIADLDEGSWRGDRPATRIKRLLDAAGVPSSWRSVDPGQIICAPTRGGMNALAHLDAVTEAEGGAWFVDRNGVFVWHDRHGPWLRGRTAASQATMSYAASTGFDRLRRGWGRLINTITVEADSGHRARAANTASVATNGPATTPDSPMRVISEGVTDAQALASHTVALWGVQAAGPEQIRFHPLAGPELLGEALLRELRDRVTVTYTPAGTTQRSSVVVVDAIRHQITPARWQVVWRTSTVDRHDTVYDADDWLWLDADHDPDGSRYPAP